MTWENVQGLPSVGEGGSDYILDRAIWNMNSILFKKGKDPQTPNQNKT